MANNKENMADKPMIDNPEELQELIDEYFADTEKPIKTITGLCLHCGFASRQSFYDYEKKEKFSYSIKRARMMIENVYEERLQGNTCTGAIFALKNFGWIDKTETEITLKKFKKVLDELEEEQTFSKICERKD